MTIELQTPRRHFFHARGDRSREEVRSRECERDAQIRAQVLRTTKSSTGVRSVSDHENLRRQCHGLARIVLDLHWHPQSIGQILLMKSSNRGQIVASSSTGGLLQHEIG